MAEVGPGGGSPASLGSIERPLDGICCWQNQPFRPPGLKELVKKTQPFRPPGLKEPVKQNQPFRPPAKALGERVSANPWPKPSCATSGAVIANAFDIHPCKAAERLCCYLD